MFKAGLKYCFGLLFLFPAGTCLSAQEQWKFLYEKEGIKVFSAYEGESDLKSFKANMLLSGSLNSFVAVLQDIENMAEWAGDLKYVQLLERYGDTVQIYYAEARAPFPFQNRDGIYLNRFYWDADSNHLYVEIELLPEYFEEKEEMERLAGKGFWSVYVREGGILDITFCMQINPGGSIPAWLANIITVDTPYDTLTELRNIIKKEKYRDQVFKFIGK